LRKFGKAKGKQVSSWAGGRNFWFSIVDLSGVALWKEGCRGSIVDAWRGLWWFFGVFCCDLGCERVFWGLIGVKNCRNGAKKLLRVVRLTIMIAGLIIRILVKGYQS
jgi:hypothetical protein